MRKLNSPLPIFFCLVLILTSCSETIWHTADARYERYDVGENAGADVEMAEMIEPYKSQLDSKMDIVIGEMEVELIKERVESSIGNWFADIMLEETQRLSTEPVDLAVQNFGGVRSNAIAAGPITIRTVYEVMPFENKMVAVDLSGVELMKLLDRIADYGGWPISRGVSFEIRDGKATNVMLNGSRIEDDKIYRLALNDYIANGGDGTSVFAGKEIYDYDLLVRDAIINHIKRDTEEGVKQLGVKEGRIVKIN